MLSLTFSQVLQERRMRDNVVRLVLASFSESLLFRLPDWTLVKIMMMVELDDLLRLRHTSRAFMRLFAIEPCFKQYHLKEEHNYKRLYHSRRVWSVPISTFPLQRAAFFASPPVCASCLQKRDGDVLGKALLSSFPFLYCSRCHTSHKSMHFSALQRQEMDDAERICFGHEGSVRICDHIILNLHQVQCRAKSASRGFDRLECRFPHNDGQSPCGVQSCPGDGTPRAHCYRDQTGNLHLKMSFSGHIPAKRLDNGKLCATALRGAIKTFQQTEGVGQWLRGHSEALGNALRVFDPNICDCVDWFGNGSGSSTRSIFQNALCPSNSTRRWREPAPLNGYQTWTSRCGQLRHGFTTRTAGTELNIDFIHCIGSNDLLVMRKVVDVEVNTTFASTSGWGDFVNLVTDSPYQDEELFGVLGCSNAKCMVSLLGDYGLDLRAIERKKAFGAEWLTQLVSS